MLSTKRKSTPVRSAKYSEDAATNGFLLGKQGVLDQVTGAIGRFAAERKRQGVTFPIAIRPSVNANSFRHLPASLEWRQQTGVTQFRR